jgi:AraC-like DNA-binding protein
MGNISHHLRERSGVTSPRPTLVAYLGARDLTELAPACRDHITVLCASTPEQVLDAIQSCCDINTLVVGDDRVASTLPLIADIAVRRPEIAVVAVVDFGPTRVDMLRALAFVGAHQFIFRNIDTQRVAVRAILGDAWLLHVSHRLETAIAECLPVALRPFIRCALLHPGCAATIGGVAALLGVNRRTLVNLCLREDMPSPSELLTICRLALAVRVLEESGRTVEMVALDLGFASGTSLRNQLKRHIGARATELRSHGGAARILEELRRRVGHVTHDGGPPRVERALPKADAYHREPSAPLRVATGCFDRHIDQRLVAEATEGISAVAHFRLRSELFAEVRRRPPRLLLFPAVDRMGLPTIPLAERCANVLIASTIAIVVDSRYSGHRPIAEALTGGMEVLPVSSPDELRRHITRHLGDPQPLISHTVTHFPNRIHHFTRER